MRGRRVCLLLLPALIKFTCSPVCMSGLFLAVLQDYEWRDYVRGKDLHKFLSSRQDLLDSFTKPQGPGACVSSAQPRVVHLNMPGSIGSIGLIRGT